MLKESLSMIINLHHTEHRKLNWKHIFFSQYAGFLFVIFAAVFVVGIISFVYKDSFEMELHSSMTKLMGSYTTDKHVQHVWNTTQADVNIKLRS
jgi:hypothetical protein